MKERTLKRFYVLVTIGFVLSGFLPCRYCQTAVASESKEALIERVDSLFKFGEIGSAEQQVLSILPRKDLNDDERVRLEVLLGSIYVAKNDSSGAYQAFQRALRVHPELTLNPDIFSPKILTVFEHARRDWKPDRTFTQSELQGIEQMRLRSNGYPVGLLFPGWGLYRQNKSLHGTVFTILEAGALLGAGYATYATSQARSNYQSATSSNVTKRWSDYRNWYRTQNTLWFVAGAVHALGWLDLSLGSLPTPSKSVSISTTLNGGGLSFVF